MRIAAMPDGDNRLKCQVETRPHLGKAKALVKSDAARPALEIGRTDLDVFPATRSGESFDMFDQQFTQRAAAPLRIDVKLRDLAERTASIDRTAFIQRDQADRLALVLGDEGPETIAPDAIALDAIDWAKARWALAIKPASPMSRA